MRAVPERVARLPFPRRRIINLGSLEFGISGVLRTTGVIASTAWNSANDPVAFPFRLSHPAIVEQLGWMNGTAAGGGVDCGIYSESWVRLVSTGAQTGSGNSTWQFIDVTDTALAPATLYYLAMSRDNTTANRIMRHAQTVSNIMLQLGGGVDSTTNAYPLPDPLTNMATAATFNVIPVLAIAMRSPF